MKLLILILFSLSIWAEDSSALSFENAPAAVKHEWRRLLHMSGEKSKVISKEFFLSQSRSPKDEWEASLKAIAANSQSAGFFDQPVACTFVARRKFFERLGLLAPQDYHCEDYQEWREGIDPQGVTLIFSSYYPNNPASHFGHTFLRLKKGRTQNDLLDYAISYSALVPEDEPEVLYALKGVFGGYKGHFDFAPYYIMVGIYNNNESRDLLEYDLGFTQEQTDRLVDHVWELYSSAAFTYYFFDENCSSVLGSLLEYARLDWNLSEGERWYYLPSELVSRVARETKNLERVGRPSLKKQAQLRSALLTERELNDLHRSKDSKDLAHLSTRTLDALLARLQFVKFKSKNQLSEGDSKLLKAALKERAARVGELTPKLHFVTSYPEEGHHPRALIASGVITEGELATVVGIKEGYHHLYDSDVGMAKYSGFDFFEARLLYHPERRKLRVDRLRLIDIYSAHPLSALDSQISWRVRAGRERAYEAGNRLWYRHEALAGVGVSFFMGEHLFSLIANAQVNHSPASYKEGGLGAMLSTELIFALGERVKWGFSGEYTRAVTSDFDLSARGFARTELALNLTQNFALHLWGRYDDSKLWQDSVSSAIEVMGRF